MKRIKFLSMTLSFVMFFTFVPRSAMTAMADEVRSVDQKNEEVRISSDDEVTNIQNGNYESGYILKELTEKREDSVKQFLLDDGTVMRQQFAVPVHYKDGEIYKEIDNALE